MTKRQKRKVIVTVLSILLIIITIERIYNSRAEFQVSAMDASCYGIVEAKLTTKEKLEDFEYLCDVLETNYPFFEVNKRQYGIDWLGNKSKYKRMIRNTKNDAEFFVALKEILRDLNNGHVSLYSGDNYKSYYKTYYLNHANGNNIRNLPRYEAFTNPYVWYRYQFDGDIEDVEIDEGGSGLETKVLIEDEVAYIRIKKMAYYDIFDEEDYPIIKEFLRKYQLSIC